MTRSPLPQRRPHEAFSFHHWQRKFTAGIGRAWVNGPVREVWINTGKTGEQSETLARDSAVILSIALQCGATIDMLRHAITRDLDGKASGPIGALLDMLAAEGGSDSPPVLPDNPRAPSPQHPAQRETADANG